MRLLLSRALQLILLATPPVWGASGEIAGDMSSRKSGFTLFKPTPDALMREMSPDRPDKTDSPQTVDAGHWQIEMDVLNYTYDAPSAAHDGVATSAIEAAASNIKLGLTNDMDGQLVFVPYHWERTNDHNKREVKEQGGFVGVTPRLKINLVGNDDGPFALALLPFVTLPWSQNGLGSRAVEGGLGVPFSFDVPGWDVGFQSTWHLNANKSGGGHHHEFDFSASIGHRLIGNLSYHVEFFANVSKESGAKWIGTVDTWLTYNISKNLRLDAGVYIGVTPAADNWRPWIGFTKRY